MAANTPFIFDYQSGKYGYNTDPARGAGTFVPFKQNPPKFNFYPDPATGNTTSHAWLQISDIAQFSRMTIDKLVITQWHASNGINWVAYADLYWHHDNTNSTIKSWRNVEGTFTNITIDLSSYTYGDLYLYVHANQGSYRPVFTGIQLIYK